jgi:3-methyladenine DNA glycosylase/8-oxoguanine DNA glycosylase
MEPSDPISRSWAPPFPLDVRATLRPLRRGPRDPSHRVEADGTIWRTAPTPGGPATLRLSRVGGAVDARAWGPGAEWLLDAVPALLGAHDEPDGFVAHHPCIADAWRRSPGLRLTSTGLVFDQIVPAVLEQKVTGIEAQRSWRELLLRFGSAAPGPAPPGMRVAPSAERLLAITTWEWHRAGVDSARQRAIRAAATVAARLEETADMSPTDAVARLMLVPGIGPWTAAEVVQRTLGAADVVSIGDYHLPSIVGWALVGRKLDDAGMLEVLARYAPHRQRAVRLCGLVGAGRPPRRGPRMPIRDYRSF